MNFGAVCLTTIGYARVSTTDQNLEIQIAALKAAGSDVIRKGDCLTVTRIDRLARSIGGLQDIVRSVKAKGASLKATEQPFDTGNIYGELTVNLLGLLR